MSHPLPLPTHTPGCILPFPHSPVHRAGQPTVATRAAGDPPTGITAGACQRAGELRGSAGASAHSASHGGQPIWAMDLRAFSGLSGPAQLRLLLQGGAAETLNEDIAERCAQPGACASSAPCGP